MSELSNDQIEHLIALMTRNGEWHRRRARQMIADDQILAAWHRGQAKAYLRMARRAASLD